MAIDEGLLGRFVATADAVVDKHAAQRTNGKVASLRTIEFSRQVLRETCRRLHTLGFYLSDVTNIKEKHIDAVVRSWHAQGLANKTMQNQLSRLRIFSGWIKKPEIIKQGGLPAYLPEVAAGALKVKTYSDQSKSWSGKGVDVIEVYKRAKLEDQRLSGMILMGLAFGFRKKEMLRIKPWKADAGHEIRVDGSVAKNGRFRSIPIELDTPYGKFQRWALDEVKSLCKKTETLGWPELTYKASENRYYYYMKRLGVTKFDNGITGHGIRAEYAENMALWSGLVPPSLGGSVNQMPKENRVAITNNVSNLLGHDKEHTIGAYFSTFRPIAHTGGIGTRIGPILVVNSVLDIFATLYANPVPVKGVGPDSSYRILTTAELEKTTVTAIVEQPGHDDQQIAISNFVTQYPELAPRIEKVLQAHGLAH